MKTFATSFAAVLIAGFIACGNLTASTITLADLPSGDTDTFSLTLNPLSGAVAGYLGATVGWGFTVTFTSTDDDWISFFASSLSSIDQAETNPDLLASYSDFISDQGGPFDSALEAASSPWTENFDGVSEGIGAYQISNDPTIAEPGATDTGEFTFDFQVFNGDPTNGGVVIGDLSGYSYYGSSTDFSVTVVPAPESSTMVLFAAGLGIILAVAYWRRATRASKSQQTSQIMN